VSVSLILVPLAISAVVAAHASRTGKDGAGRLICHVQTRMRDRALLAEALRYTGADVTVLDDALVANWEGVRATFQRDDDGVWTAHLEGFVDDQRAVEIVTAVDAGYGRLVQGAVLNRLRERAPAAGLRLESESMGADASVSLVFAVEDRV